MQSVRCLPLEIAPQRDLSGYLFGPQPLHNTLHSMAPMLIFAIVTLTPCILAGFAVIFGGSWALSALLYMTLLVASMDRLNAATADAADPEAEFPASTALLVVLGLIHFLLLAGTLWAVAGPSNLSIAGRIALGGGVGLIFGQISHPVAHELIHKNTRWMRWLGQCMYTSLLAGHHASAHVLIHHVYVGSDQDPNSAPKGENFYRYILRVTRKSFYGALKLETARRVRARKSSLGHPFVLYVGGGLILLAGVTAGFGWIGLLAFLSIVAHAQIQILMSDYVQHYGLRRVVLPDGKLEPVGPQHSWNAPDVFSSFLMVNAPRHSDHHVAPNRPYPALKLETEDMPLLPYSLPVMGVIALFPKIWFRLMNPLCDTWQATPNAVGKAQPMDRPLRRNSRSHSKPHLAQSSHVHTPSNVWPAGPDLPR